MAERPKLVEPEGRVIIATSKLYKRKPGETIAGFSIRLDREDVLSKLKAMATGGAVPIADIETLMEGR